MVWVYDLPALSFWSTSKLYDLPSRNLWTTCLKRLLCRKKHLGGWFDLMIDLPFGWFGHMIYLPSLSTEVSVFYLKINLLLGGLTLWSTSCFLLFVSLSFYLPLYIFFFLVFFCSFLFNSPPFFFPCCSFLLSLLFPLSSLCCQDIMLIKHSFLAFSKMKTRKEKKRREEGKGRRIRKQKEK